MRDRASVAHDDHGEGVGVAVPGGIRVRLQVWLRRLVQVELAVEVSRQPRVDYSPFSSEGAALGLGVGRQLQQPS